MEKILPTLLTITLLMLENIQTETDPLHYIESLENSIYIPEIYMDEVRPIISAITNSASGNDELPASIIKQCMELLYVEVGLLYSTIE